MMYINGLWYHILEVIETPFHNEKDFKSRIEYIILQGGTVKYFRPDHFPFEQRITNQDQLSKTIQETESVTWRSEERRRAYLEHYKMVSQIMREHIIKEVLTDRSEYNFDVC